MAKKLILKLVVFLLICLILIEGLIFLSPFKELDNKTDFAAAIIDKQQILREARSPKIVLVGGSSVAYGIDSQLIKDSLNYDVVNMSFQYFLGSDFLIKQVENELKIGDILLLSFEYISTDEGDVKEKFRAANYYPKAYSWISTSQTTLTELISGFLRYRIDKFRSIAKRLFKPYEFNPSVEDTENIFFRNAIDKNGDLVSHLNNPNVPFKSNRLTIDSTYTLIAKNINLNTKKLISGGVDVVYTFPPYNETSFQLDSDSLSSIESKFKKEIKISLLDNYMDNVYSDSLFLDMCYHLNKDGRRKRTLKLIQNLKKHLERSAI